MKLLIPFLFLLPTLGIAQYTTMFSPRVYALRLDENDDWKITGMEAEDNTWTIDEVGKKIYWSERNVQYYITHIARDPHQTMYVCSGTNDSTVRFVLKHGEHLIVTFMNRNNVPTSLVFVFGNE